MNVVVNGEQKSVPEGSSITDLIRSLNLDKLACAVEVNKRLVRKAEHQSATLRDGDVVEVVTLVGGG